MKRLLLLPFLLTALLAIGQVKTIKIPPNKDTVLVTSTTKVITTVSVSTTVIPTKPVDTVPDPPVGSGEINLSFTPETAFFQLPGAGAENWNGQNYAPVPGNRMDLYFRFLWTQLEGSTAGSYNWTVFDRWVNQAIDNNQRFNFGVFLLCPGGCDPFNGPVYYDGASSGYPLYLHTLMQSEAVKDWRRNGAWVPNWNSESFQARLQLLLYAMRNHIATGSYKGVAYKNVMGYIDVRIMGSYGEWHHAGIVDYMTQYPAGMRPVVSSYKKIIDAHISAFPNYQLVMLLAALDAERLNNTMTPVEVTNYALTARNNYGLLGIRSDQRGSLQWNDPGNYVHQYMENNFKNWGGPTFNTLTMSRWQTAPLVGEPENNSDNPQLQTLVAQTQLYKQNSIGNGNYTRSSAADQNMINAVSIMGYRLAPVSGKITWSGSTAVVSLNWQNKGLTPCYENWNVVFDFVNSSGVAVKSVVSSFKPRLFLPAVSSAPFIDQATGLVAGAYTVKMTVRDSLGYRQPMPLAIKGRNADGSYTLGSIVIK